MHLNISIEEKKLNRMYHRFDLLNHKVAFENLQEYLLLCCIFVPFAFYECTLKSWLFSSLSLGTMFQTIQQTLCKLRSAQVFALTSPSRFRRRYGLALLWSVSEVKTR